MTQPLNYTPKAIADLMGMSWEGAPASVAITRYLINKLRQAQVFVLSDHGELLDRSKPRPEVPGVLFKPAFPVVALEYTALAQRRTDPFYTCARSSRRIALAWDWQDDLPAGFGKMPELSAGVVIASISYMDEHDIWMPMMGACHFAYDDQWQHHQGASGFREAMIATGSLPPNVAREKGYPSTAVPLLYEACLHAQQQLGSRQAVFDIIAADVTDEVNAYTDLCYALACKNVRTRECPAPVYLNRQRLKKGKLPLTGFHVLELAGAEAMPGAGGSGDRSGPRSHLRRGHIRRLAADRVTWVNSTVVRGRGFVDKVYAA